MIDASLLKKVKEMSPAQRLDLIGMVWDSLEPAQTPVTEAEKRLLDKRLKDVKEEPSLETSWPEVRSRLRKRLH